MPLPPPEQIADEALALRTTAVDRAGRSPGSGIIRARAAAMAQWAWENPALDAIAEQRQQAIAALGDDSVTPDPDCLADADDVHLRTVQDSTLSHRYRVHRQHGARWDQIGAAWLTGDPNGHARYVVRVDLDTTYGDRLREALDRMAVAIAGSERRDREHRNRTGGR